MVRLIWTLVSFSISNSEKENLPLGWQNFLYMYMFFQWNWCLNWNERTRTNLVDSNKPTRTSKLKWANPNESTNQPTQTTEPKRANSNGLTSKSEPKRANPNEWNRPRRPKRTTLNRANSNEEWTQLKEHERINPNEQILSNQPKKRVNLNDSTQTCDSYASIQVSELE